MMHALTIEVTEEVYQSLLHSAEQTGQQPEVVAAELVANAARTAKGDPLRTLFGTLETAIPDWGDRHDHYIGESLLSELNQSDLESGNDR